MEKLQAKGICAVGLRVGWVVVDLEEKAVNAGRDGGTREQRSHSGWPPEPPLAADGICTEWVPSKTTGASWRMMASERISTTRLL